jgi:SRSO17 transposase
MNQKRTEKKKFHENPVFVLPESNGINRLVSSLYGESFTVYRKRSTRVAGEYLCGLLQCEKGHENMERMVEKVTDSDYKRYIHFLSSSPWDHKAVNLITMNQVNSLLIEQKRRSGKPTGMTIDETSHLKKGNKSVGVSRQYAGVSGKVENSQVSVHTSLSNEKYCSLIGTELFLPESWANDPQRCRAAGIPLTEQVHRTKPELALKLIKQAIAAGVEFDFINGDGLYGHNPELTRALDDLDQFYVLDIHKDEHIFLSEPVFEVPDKKSGRGRPPRLLRPNIASIQVQDYLKTLTQKDFTTVKVRKTAKGWKRAKVHTVTLWHWDAKEQHARKRTLVITLSDRLKFSLSNGCQDQYSAKQWAYFQCCRYWVERCFDDSKNELGMSGYQVTGWMAWQHHMALVMMAGFYILKIKLENQQQMPLLSVRDARLLVIAINFASQYEVDLCIQHMTRRHKQRQKDIDKYY